MSQFQVGFNYQTSIYFIDDVYTAVKSSNENNNYTVYDYNFKLVGVGYYNGSIPGNLKITQFHIKPPLFAIGFNISSMLFYVESKNYAIDRELELYHKKLFTFKRVDYNKTRRVYKTPNDIHIMYWHTKIVKPVDFYKYMLIQFYGCADIANTIGWYMLEYKRLDLQHYPKED